MDWQSIDTITMVRTFKCVQCCCMCSVVFIFSYVFWCVKYVFQCVRSCSCVFSCSNVFGHAYMCSVYMCSNKRLWNLASTSLNLARTVIGKYYNFSNWKILNCQQYVQKTAHFCYKFLHNFMNYNWILLKKAW